MDALGKDKSELFLVKLALLAAQQLGDEAVFGDLIERAQKDLWWLMGLPQVPLLVTLGLDPRVHGCRDQAGA